MLQVSLICCVSQQIIYNIEFLREHKTYELRKFSLKSDYGEVKKKNQVAEMWN